jgi:hypothetical protein
MEFENMPVENQSLLNDALTVLTRYAIEQRYTQMRIEANTKVPGLPQITLYIVFGHKLRDEMDVAFQALPDQDYPEVDRN